MQFISASKIHLFYFVDEFPRPFSKASEGLSQFSYMYPSCSNTLRFPRFRGLFPILDPKTTLIP